MATLEAYPGRMFPTRAGAAALVTAGLLLGGLLLGGCSDGDNDRGSAAPGGAPSTTAAPATTTTSTVLPSSTTAAPAQRKLSPSGYGRLTLGMTLDEAKSGGHVTNVRPGCEFAGPGQMTADVPDVPQAYATFDDGKLTNLALRQGETAEGLRVGATIDQAKQAYSGNGYSVTVDETPVEVFDFISVSVKRNGADAYEFAADPKTRTIRDMAVPHLLLCD